MAGDRGDGHRVVARVFTRWGADVSVRVDPDDRQVLAVAAGKLTERRHAHRAFTPEGRDPGRVIVADDLQRGRELIEDDSLSLDAVA